MIVVKALKPSGIAATANEIATTNAVLQDLSAAAAADTPGPAVAINIPICTTNTITNNAAAAQPKTRDNFLSLSCNGVKSISVASIRPEIFPISVAPPVAVTTAVAVPFTTAHEEKT